MTKTINEIAYQELTFAECAKCGIEIAFASSEQFEKLVKEHEHAYRW
jgi:hypothetical protein